MRSFLLKFLTILVLLASNSAVASEEGKKKKESPAEEVNFDYSPRIIVGVYGGFYRSFVPNFEKKNLKEPTFGTSFAVQLFNIGYNKPLYTVFQYNTFVARLRGRKLIKSHQRYLNIGLRYGLIHSALERPTALFWLGTGISRINLERKDFIIVDRIIWENNEATVITVDKSIIDHFNSTSFYIEVGQMIPFQESLFPIFGMWWNIKYDHGRDRDVNVSSFSITLGLYFSAIY